MWRNREDVVVDPNRNIRGGVAFPTRPATKTYLRSSDLPRAGLCEGEWFEPGAFGRCGQAWVLLSPVDWSLLFVVATGCAFQKRYVCSNLDWLVAAALSTAETPGFVPIDDWKFCVVDLVLFEWYVSALHQSNEDTFPPSVQM